MAKELFVLPVFNPAQYDAFRREIGANLADTYDEWCKLFADEVSEAMRQGDTVVEV
jgi:trehalose-6-phosphate synthase